MKRPIQVPACIPDSFTPLWFFFGGAGLGSLAYAWSGHVGIAIISLSWVAGWIVGNRAKLRLRGRGAILTEHGIGATQDGHVVWLIPWAEFGSYRQIDRGHWARTWDPQQEGVELLDPDGAVIGLLNVHPKGGLYGGSMRAYANMFARNAFFRELDARAQTSQNGTASAAEKPLATTMWKVTLQVLVGVVASTLALYPVLLSWRFGSSTDSSMHSPWFLSPWVVLGALAAMTVGVVELFAGLFGLAYLRNPERFNKKPPKIEPLPPVEGPTYEEFLIEKRGAMTELEEGHRYRYVHPEARELDLRGEEKILRVSAVISTALTLVSLLVLSREPQFWWGGFLVSLLPLPFAYLFFLLGGSARSRLENLHDTLYPTEGGLVVVKPDGTTLTFCPSARRQLGRLRQWILSAQQCWKENGLMYIVDQRHLYKADANKRERTLSLTRGT